jgi:outer membrane protein OmpA-like peptidoglycan-associated protein
MPALVGRTGVSLMRRQLSVGLLLALGACTLVEPSGQRDLVFFEGSSAQLDDAAKGVVAGAADWAKRHPAMPVVVASYTDPYGSQQANSDFTRLRAQAVIDGLVADGVPAARIQRRDMGATDFKLDPQESRRVEITIGQP